jgi:hypothetical protein
MALDKTPALFCTRCFASDTDGSWNHIVLDAGEGGYCTNCGGGGTSVQIPRWAVDEIRRNASWVGKRYYPSDEDKEKYDELRRLRAFVTHFPGRTAEPPKDERDEDMWCVVQKVSKTKNVSTVVRADSEEDALEQARTLLPYIPEEMLDG